MLQVQFNVIGLFLIGLSTLVYFTTGDSVLRGMMHRPGVPLLVVGLICLMQAGIAFAGSEELRQGSGWG